MNNSAAVSLKNFFQVLCELPESYEAYRKQQHRWHSGPMQLFRLCLPAIITSKVMMHFLLLSVHCLVVKYNLNMFRFLNIADCVLEENQPNFSVLSS